MVVHGGPGVGKTELAAHVRAWAMEHDLTVLSGRTVTLIRKGMGVSGPHQGMVVKNFLKRRSYISCGGGAPFRFL